MTLQRERALSALGLMVTLVLSLVTFSGSSFAQDNSQGRYRPEGRQIGLAAGREFDERVYEVRTYQPDVSTDAFAGAMVFYPLTLSFDLPNGAIAFVPGFRANAAMYEWWGPALASLGYTVFILETNSPTDTLAARADALIAAVDFIKSENQNADAPIVNKIDPDKIAIMGHSMGGGGTLLAANEFSEELKAAIPFTPWLPDADFSSVTVPTLLIAGEIDRIASVAEHARPHYDSLSNAVPRMYLEIKDGNHFIANSLTENEGLNPNLDVHDLVGSMAVAWLKLFMDGEEAYRELVFGDLPPADRDRLSNWEYVE